MVYLLVGKLVHQKYGDPRSLLIIIYIATTTIPNVLDILAFSINIMTIEISYKLCLKVHLMKTILKMVDQSKGKIEALIEDIIVVI